MKGFALVVLLAASFFSDAKGRSIHAENQLAVLHLLEKVHEPIPAKHAYLKEAADHFDPTSDPSLYYDSGAAAEKLYNAVKEHRVLEKHRYFSIFNEKHRHDAIMLFEVMMNCIHWACGIDNAAYFRDRMNEGAFTYAFYTTIVHHPFTDGVILPPHYEVLPHMFTTSEIINKAYSAKMTQTPSKFHMDFTGSPNNKESRVAYFGEDIGLNAHHVFWHMDFPFWWDDHYGHHFDRKGELFFWVHHQLTARFDAERLSNYMDEVDELYWTKPIVDGFAPHTTYKYGGEFPARPDNIDFHDVDGVARIRDMIITEQRIRDAIAHGYIVGHNGEHIDIRGENGIDILGDIIESSTYSPNPEYYGALHNYAHRILGSQSDPHGKFNMPPGVMEHFETATRDPSFFRLHKYMDNIFKEHKDSLPHYTKAEVEFPGIAIDDVKVGKLETYFNDFEFSLVNAVDDSDKVEDVAISAIVSLIHHEPFDLEIDVTNNNGGDAFATVRVFLCPRRNGNGVIYDLNEGRWHCIEMDKFWRTLHSGSNHIVRHAIDSSVTSPDIPSFADLYSKASAAKASGTELELPSLNRGCGIPDRMLLPKGTEEGMEFALVVVLSDGSKDAAVADLEKHDHHVEAHTHCGMYGKLYPDKRPMGYPLDRNIPDERVLLNFPNLHRSIVTVTHNSHHE